MGAGAIASLDSLRSRALSLVAPLAPRLLRDRDRRVAVYGLVSVALCLAFTLAAPTFLLAIGPIVLGVPHLVADVRYLVARPGLHRRAAFWLAVALPAGAAWFHPHASVSLLAPAFAALAARASLGRRAFAAALAFGLVALAIHFGRAADLVLAHGHNIVAIVLFCLWSRGRGRLHWLVVLAFGAGLATIAFGALDRAPMPAVGDLDAETLAASLAPLEDPVFALRGVLAFAFAQSVHYAVWVRLIPESDRPRPGIRGFASSGRALMADLGIIPVGLAAILALGLAAWGCASLGAARDGYLRLAIFHGPLELGVLVLVLLESPPANFFARKT